jgi:hypothetical protein
MNLSLRTTVSRYLPPWFQARLASGKVRAFKYIYSICLLGDGLIENAYQGVQAQYPGLCPPDAYAFIGRDRMIIRGLSEDDDSYAARLINWLVDWKGAGNPFAIMQQVRGFLTPSTAKLRIVNQSGSWYTLNSDGSIEIHQTYPASNWNWDNDPTKPTRFWLIIYSDAGPWVVDRKYGDGSVWGDGRSWGTSAPSNQVQLLRQIVDNFKSAGDLCPNVIVAFDPASFDPTAAPNSPGMPDGTWGNWSTIVSGVRVPSRLATARYFDGAS